MRNRQTGITAIGFLIIAALVGMIGIAALKLTPIYLEHMKIVSVLEDVKNEMEGTNPSIALIRSAIGKRINIEMITVLKREGFKIKKSEAGYSVRAQYDAKTNYFGNIYILVSFNDAVEIRR